MVYPPTRWKKDRPIRPCSPHTASVLNNTPPKWPNTLPSYVKLPSPGCQTIEGVRKSDATEAAEYPSFPCEVATAGCKRIEGVRPKSKLCFRFEVATPGRKYEGLRNANIGTFLIPRSHQRLGAEFRQRIPTLAPAAPPGDSCRNCCRRPTVGRYTALVLTKRPNARYGTRSFPERWPVSTITRFGLLPAGKVQLPTNCRVSQGSQSE